MTDGAEAAIDRISGWWHALAATLIGAIALSIAVVYVDYVAGWAGVFPADWDSSGLSSNISTRTPPGWSIVTRAAPDYAAARAGVRQGDLIRFDAPFDIRRHWALGERIGIRYRRDGVERHATIVLTPSPDTAARRLILREFGWNAIARLSVLGLSVLLLVRRWRDPAARYLGLGLIGISIGIHTLPHWLHEPGWQVAVLVLQALGYILRAAIVPAAWHLARQPGAQEPRGWFAAWWAIAAPLATIIGVSVDVPIAVPLIGSPLVLAFVYSNATLALAGLIIARHFSATSGAQRNRIKLAALAFALFLVEGQFAAIGAVTPSVAAFLAVRLAADVLTVCATAILGFAMLRHKLFDFGFAVNRTLVFGVVSFVLLACFGLGEKLADALIPEAWHGGSAVTEGAIALGLFLSFHRLRDWIEARIERLLFRAWHRNEAALRGFVERAAHYERRETLARDAAGEFHRFTQTHAALFWHGETGDFTCIASAPSWPQSSVDADDRALTQARAGRGAVDVTECGSALAAELVLPVIDHGTLLGFVAVAPKPNGIGYRPDEVAAMASAAQHVGLDLQAMRARQLAADNAALEAQVAQLSQILAQIPAAREAAGA